MQRDVSYIRAEEEPMNQKSIGKYLVSIDFYTVRIEKKIVGIMR